MAKLTEYPQATKFDANDILIKDGTNGTKKITAEDAAKDLVGKVVKVTEVSGEGTKISVVNGNDEIELAKQNDLSNTENDANELKTQMYNYNSVNVLPISSDNSTSSSITFISNKDGSYTVNGTATGPAFYKLFSSSTSFPFGMEAGKTYIACYNGYGVVSLRFYKYVNGSMSDTFLTLTSDYSAGYKFTVPSDAEGVQIRLHVVSGNVVPNVVVHPLVLNSETNKTLTDKLSSLSSNYATLQSQANTTSQETLNIAKDSYRDPFVNMRIEKGGIDETRGSETSDIKLARRNSSIFPNKLLFMDTDEYMYRLFYFIDGTGTTYYHGNYTNFVSGTAKTYIDDYFGNRALPVFKRSDDADMTEDDYEKIANSVHAYSFIPEQFQIAVKRNNTTYVNQIIELAQDWYSHRNDLNSQNQKVMTYGQTTMLDKSSYTRDIDCSTFVGMLLRGYGFNATPYYTEENVNPASWTGNTNYVWSINPFDWKNMSRVSSSGVTPIRTASQFAKWMVDRGQRVPIDTYFANIEPGDILFFAAHSSETGDWSQPGRFMRINHIAICISKERATAVGGWDTEKYPFKHSFMEVGHEDTETPDGVVKIRVLESPQNEPDAIYANNINTLCLVCRPDLGSL